MGKKKNLQIQWEQQGKMRISDNKTWFICIQGKRIVMRQMLKHIVLIVVCKLDKGQKKKAWYMFRKSDIQIKTKWRDVQEIYMHTKI